MKNSILPCPTQTKLDPPHQQARCKDSRQKLSENCVLVGTWARICNCTHASFIPGSLVTQQHVGVNGQDHLWLQNVSHLTSSLFKETNKIHLEWLMMVASPQYQIRPSPTELLYTTPNPNQANIQSRVAKTIGKTKARANFKSVDWHKGFASDAALSDYFDFHQSISYLRHLRLVFLEGTL